MTTTFFSTKTKVAGNITEISDEAGLNQLARAAQDHLAVNPEDGILMLADYESFAFDLGFEFSPKMLAHVRKNVGRDPADSPRAKLAYEKLKSDGKRDNFQIAAQLEFDGQTKKEIPQWQPAHLQLPADVAIEPGQAAGYGVLIQVSEEFCNAVLGVMYDKSAIRSEWSGSKSTHIPDLSVNLVADYRVKLEQPALSFLESSKPDEAALVGLDLTATATVTLTVEFLPLSGAALPIEKESFNLEVGLGIAIESSLDISKPDAKGQSAVIIDLKNIRDLKIIVDGDQLEPQLLAFVTEILKRIVRSEVEFEKQIAISQMLDTQRYGGVPVSSVGVRTLVAAGAKPACLTVGLDFAGSGREMDIGNLIPGGESYAFIVTKSVFDAVWNANKHKIKGSGKVELSNPKLVLMDGHLAFSINARYEVFDLGGCGWVSWHINASARAGFAFEPFSKDGIYYIRPKLVSGPDVDMDDWDQFLLSFLVGFLLTIIGINWSVGSVIAFIALEILIGKVEEQAANEIQGYSIGLRGEVPGTNVIAISTTPTAPVIFRSGITAHGGIAFITK